MTRDEIKLEVLDILSDIAPDEDLSQLKDEVSHGGASQRACEYILRELRHGSSPRKIETPPPAERRAA